MTRYMASDLVIVKQAHGPFPAYVLCLGSEAITSAERYSDAVDYISGRITLAELKTITAHHFERRVLRDATTVAKDRLSQAERILGLIVALSRRDITRQARVQYTFGAGLYDEAMEFLKNK